MSNEVASEYKYLFFAFILKICFSNYGMLIMRMTVGQV